MTTAEEGVRARRRNNKKVRVLILGTVALVVATGATFTGMAAFAPSAPARMITAAHEVVPPEVAPARLTSGQVRALPAAVYNAVIPGLLGYADTSTDGVSYAYTATSDVPVFGADHITPIAKLPAKDFLGEPTVIVPVKVTKEWALVLTPARQITPSSQGGHAAAQTAGWVPLDSITKGTRLDATVRISVSKQTLTIVRGGHSIDYAIGVGSDKTPTPTGTTGYIQARYDDSKQAEYPIQLTSLHSAAVDEPFGGKDGGLIGIHYNSTNSGAVSHGCVRLTYAALVAVNQLPIGTPVVMTT